MTWDEFWQSISVFQAAAWVAAATVVATFVIRVVWPQVRAFVRFMDAIALLPKFMVDTAATLKAQDTKIADIHHEVRYNNGSSVKDALKRVELGVKGILDAADVDRAELREDLESTGPHAPARKRPPKG